MTRMTAATKRRKYAPDAQTSLRLPQTSLDRADALIELIFQSLQQTSNGLITLQHGWGRSDVLRLAIERGLVSLEQEYER